MNDIDKSQPATSSGNVPEIEVRHWVGTTAWIIAIFLIYWFFDSFKIVLLGFLAAVSMASALKPAVRKAPGPRNLRAVVIGVLPPILLLGMLALVIWILAVPIKRELSNLPQMEAQADQFLTRVGSMLNLSQPLTVRDLLPRLYDVITGERGAKFFSTTTNVVSGILIAFAFVFIGSIYILIDPPIKWLPEVLKLIPGKWRAPVRAAFRELGPKLRWWMIGTIIGAVTIGVASGIGYALVGLNFAIPIAFFAGVSEVVPTVGPLVTFIIALIFAATQSLGTVIGVVIVYAIVQGLESYLLMPLIMKKAVEVPPLVTLFTIIFWGSIFGLPGLLLAIPLNLTVWSFATNLIVPASERPESQQSPSE
jgi:predicted PurR-regulated permease PerM